MNTMNKRALVFAIVSTLILFWTPAIQSESKRVDNRRADVIGAQIKSHLDFLLAPSDFLKDDPELIGSVILPAMGFQIDYDDSSR